MRLVVEACPEAATMKDIETQSTPLHYFMNSGAPLSAVACCVLGAAPAAAEAKDALGFTPLHLGIQQKAPVAVVASLLACAPNSAKILTPQNESPLHLCISYQAAGEIVDTVLAAWPQAANQLDANGKTPHALGVESNVAEGILRILDGGRDYTPSPLPPPMLRGDGGSAGTAIGIGTGGNGGSRPKSIM